MHEELKKIGLSENEASVYLALLELGNATAQQIAQKAQVNRATTYVQLDTLMKMGLVSTFEKGAKTLFRAEDPEYLRGVIEREKIAIGEREKKLADVMPGLEKLFTAAGERPRVRFFEGAEGLRNMMTELLKTKDKDIEAIMSTDDFLQLFPSHQQDYPKLRVQKGIHSKLIYTSSRGHFLKQTDKVMLRESRILPLEKFPFTCDMAIYENRVAISALRTKPFGLVIESDEIAQSLKAVFYLAWEAAEKYQKE